jgi:F-box domain.
MEHLPLELKEEIAYDLPLSSLMNLCLTSKSLLQVCEDRSFWSLKLSEFGIDPSELKENDSKQIAYNFYALLHETNITLEELQRIIKEFQLLLGLETYTESFLALLELIGDAKMYGKTSFVFQEAKTEEINEYFYDALDVELYDLAAFLYYFTKGIEEDEVLEKGVQNEKLLRAIAKRFFMFETPLSDLLPGHNYYTLKNAIARGQKAFVETYFEELLEAFERFKRDEIKRLSSIINDVAQNTHNPGILREYRNILEYNF